MKRQTHRKSKSARLWTRENELQRKSIRKRYLKAKREKQQQNDLPL